MDPLKLQATPPQVHLGFTHTREPQRVAVRVLNTSSQPSRLHLAPLSLNAPFKANLEKRSTLAPGMNDTLNIEFIPGEYKHYREFARISSDHGDVLEVPLEAYPIMNEQILTSPSSLFPKNIDFGACAISSQLVKSFRIRNVLPSIEFDFEIIVLVPHPYFQIYPLKGTIPSDGELTLTVIFSPLEMCTSSCKVKLVFSQYGYIPFVTTICGSATSFKTESKVVQLPQITTSAPSTPSSPNKPSQHKKKNNKLPISRMDKSPRSASPTSQLTPTTPNDTVDVNGVLFSSNVLTTHAGVATLMMHQPGKEKMKEIKAARRKKDSGTTGTSDGTFNDEGLGETGVRGRQVKELVFGQLVKANMEYERSKELKWFVCIGRLPFTEEEKQEILRERDVIPSSEGMRAASNAGSGRVVTPAHSKPNFTPTFDSRKNSAWGIRAWAIKRFVRAVRCVIVQLRASKRLTAMHSFLKQYGYDRIRIADAGAADWNGTRSSTPTRSFPPSSTKEAAKLSGDAIVDLELKDSRIQYLFFPAFRSELSFFEEGEGLVPLPVPHIKEIVQVFDELGTFELKVGNSVALEYHPYTLSSSRVGSYIQRADPTISTSTSLQGPSSPPGASPSPVPSSQPSISLVSSGIMRTGAHEEDLCSLAAIQTMALQPEKSQLEDQTQEKDQDIQPEQPELQPEEPQDSLETDQHDNQEANIPPLSSPERYSHATNPLANSYLPPLPQEFLKVPRAGPPNGSFTLDILRTAIVYASPPTVTETDITYPLRPYIRELGMTEEIANTLDSLQLAGGSLAKEEGELSARKQSVRVRVPTREGSAVFTPFQSSKFEDNATVHKSTPDSLEGAYVPDLVSPLSLAISVDEHSTPDPVDLEAIKSQYLNIHNSDSVPDQKLYTLFQQQRLKKENKQQETMKLQTHKHKSLTTPNQALSAYERNLMLLIN